MINKQFYTTQLQAGLGMISETLKLLEIWKPDYDATKLYEKALDNGHFPNVSARRLRNIVKECFKPRFLNNNGKDALHLKTIADKTPGYIFSQVLFIYCCRANRVFFDFIKYVYWSKYSGGYNYLTMEDSETFVSQANAEGKPAKPWSSITEKKISGYLIGCCRDYGLVGNKKNVQYKVLTFKIKDETTLYLAHELHFKGLGDNAIVNHEDWGLFGLESRDVQEELKRLSTQGHFIIQAAGDVTRISWKYKSMEEFLNAIVEK